MPTIKIRRNTAAAASQNNAVLADGEPGYEVDSRIFKVGDGITPWNDLEPILGLGGGAGVELAEGVPQAVFWGIFEVGSEPTPPSDGRIHFGFRVVPAA